MTPFSIDPAQPNDAEAKPDAFRKPPASLPTAGWLAQGLRAAFFIRPVVAGHAPTAAQFVLLVMIVAVLEVAALRFEAVSPVVFNFQAWVSAWWITPVFVGFVGWCLQRTDPDQPSEQRTDARSPPIDTMSACVVLWLIATVPGTLASAAIMGSISQGWVKTQVLNNWIGYWSIYLFFVAWSIATGVWLLSNLSATKHRLAISALVLVLASGLTATQFNVRAWQTDYAAQSASEPEPVRLHLSQPVFEAQQALWQRTVAELAPERPGVTDVYGLVFAPFAGEDVFLRESTLVARLLAERFDAAGRTVHLVNHATTAETHPWATPLNLARAIEALAAKMDREKDVLVIYLTSHGAKNFQLAASHWPLEVDALTPVDLKAALDRAGIRNRVIAVSACFSGRWIDTLASDTTLVMTAADATHTSYGCGRRSELTFFGRAVFDEQLRKTHSFEQAFTQAVPLIKQREVDAGKDDGFSNPQIRIGASIRAVLIEVEQRLGTLPAAAAPAAEMQPASAAMPPATLAQPPASSPPQSRS
jgi:hypothetical protein